jgi:glucose/arabinose dehydrogenase
MRPVFSRIPLRWRENTADGQTVRYNRKSSTRSSFVLETLEPRLLLSAGLTAGYAFDETSGTTAADATSHAIVGTLTNGPAWTTGQYGNAVNLDGVNDYVNLGNPTVLQVTGSLTLSGWINASAFPVDDAAVVSKRIDGLGFQLDVTRDTGLRTIGFKLTNSTGGQMFRYGATTLQPNTWYHIAGVYDAATQSLHVYLNGQLDDGALQGTVTATQQNSTANVTIGRRAGNTGYEFAGRIDDVRIYDRALAVTEIQTDMVTPLGTVGSTDPNPPLVQLNQPAQGALVSDIVVVTALATDDVGIASVQFLVDGVQTGTLDTVTPYALTWDTRTVSNGTHTLTAQAFDTSGNAAVSSPVTVNVSNSSFFRNEILATGFDLPTAIKFLPDGRMLVVEFAGTIRVVPAPYTQVDPTPFLQLTDVPLPGPAVNTGIIDLALDPNFSTNHFYYIFYTAGTSTSHDRLSRFTANASLTGTIAGSEFVLYEDPLETTASSQSHHGGAITFGNDGKIYFTTGDHFIGSNSQLLTSPRGKLHRINQDGTVPTDNPFYDGAGPNWDSIWAIGLRNPYRAYYDAPTDRLLIGDVGGNDNSTSIEEVNVGVRGANYGWPNVEGTSTDPAHTNPLYAYPHNGRDASITGGFVYHGTQFPSSYQGNYFFADYTQNWIRRLTFDATGNVTGVFNFEPADGSVDGPYGDIVYLTEGPDGALYYVDIGYSDIGGTFGVSKIRRVEFIQSNIPPVVAASATPLGGPAALTVDFSSTGSADPEGLPLTYLWAFGDGQTSIASNPQHTYANAGLYQARLTVSDGVNSTLSTPITITVGNTPVVTLLTTPSDGGLFRAGDVITYSAQATDIEDGQLPASAFTWNIDFLHEGHVHPGIPITGVTSGSFQIPTSGHDFSGFTRYRIRLEVTDSDGLQSTQSATVFPDKVDLTFDTAPGGLTLYVDDIAHQAPFVADTLIGFNHMIDARNQTGSTSTYTFASWSDGGAQQHTITAPAVPQSYTANYTAVPNPQTAGLVAGYAFDELTGTTAADASGQGLVGTLTNGPTFTTGKNGNALTLDGVNDYVTLGNPTALQITGSLTLSGWINASAFPVNDAAVVSKRASGPLGFQLDVTKDTGPRTIGFKLTNSTGGQMFRWGATTLQLNTWYHIAGVYDAATQSLHVYLNGQLDDGALLGTVTATQQNSTTNVTIGRRAGNTGFEFAGRIDDVRIYDRALAVTEIQTDMVTPLGASAPDTLAPTVQAINRVGSTPTNAGSVQWTVTFSETVTGVDLSDFALAASGVTGATLTGISGSGSVYTVTASTGTGNGTLGLNLVDDNSILDSATNPLGGAGGIANGNFTGQVYTIDTAAASVTIDQAAGQADPTSASPINFTVVFSETVTGFAANDISFAGSTVGGPLTAVVTGTGPTYTVAVSGMTGTGTVVASVLAGAATDAAGNTSLASTSTDNTATFNATAVPTVLSINRVSPTPTNAGSVQWTVTFSETVTGVDLTDFALVASGVTGATLSPVVGTGSVYTVTASTGTGNGTLGLNLVDDDSIVDASSNPLGGAGTGNGAFTGQSYTIDTAAPSVTIDQAAGQADPTSANPINFTVVFSEAVTGFAANDISFAGSTVGGPLTAVVTGTGPTYTVAVSGMTGTGTVVASVLAGAATDAAGNLNQASTSTDDTVTFSVSQTAGLVAGYAFDETTGTTTADASGQGLVGTLTNGPTWTIGQHGNAINLDGVNDYVNLGNPSALQLTGSITVSGWVNASAFPVDDAAVVSKRISELGFQLDVTKDTGPRTIGFKLTNSSGGQMFRYGATTLQLNTWYHIAGVYDAATQSLHVYLNGQLDDGVLQGTVTATQQNSTANVTIGRRAGNTGYEFAGRVDDVRIYDRALAVTEIQTDMVTPLGTVSSTDPNPPLVQLNQPAQGALVSDIVVVGALATDDVGVAGVQFYVDGVLTGALDLVAPYALTWDTRTVSNGAHTLTAQAYDTSGNSTVSSPVTVNVSNSNFFRNEILATGFNLPTAIKFLPDGRLLVVELAGTIRIVPAPYTQPDPTPFLQLTNVGSAGVQQGIYDIALDPNFSTNHFYYIFYTLGSPNHDRLSRFTANASLTGTIPGSELVLYEDPQIAHAEHHGGAVNFGNDGKIYFTTGEHFQGTPSQSLTSPRGKLHRINSDGTVPTDNPFYDGAGPNWDSIWAIGLRNPFRAYYDAPTDRLFIGDVGGNDASTAQEEINVGVRGANYGWPNVEGTSTNPAHTNPIYSYPHNGRDASITGGFVYHGTQFPSSYQGNYFFADYTQNWIRRLTFDASGNVTGVFNFEPADGSVDGPYGDIVYLTEGPDGALYYVDLGYSDISGNFGVSKIRRIEFVQSNLPPVVAASATPVGGAGSLTFNFSSTGSADPEGLPLTYLWAFGDGQTSTLANPQHTYANAGLYQARLTVFDGVNSTLSPPLSISAGNQPVIANLLAIVPPNPSNNGFFRAGDVITYSAEATDIEDGQLPASAFTWTIDFLHEGHVHPGASITGVTSGSFAIPTSGHDFGGFTRYRITLTVTDSSGLQSSQSTIVFPDKVNLTFETAPTGLTLYVDGIARQEPFVYDTLIGFSHTIEARNQTVSTSTYTFASWSDGGTQSHQIIVPTGAQSYTATYTVVTNPLPAGLAAGWSFNEASGTSATDSSGNGNTATLVNGVAQTAGNYGGGLTFDGVNDYLTVPDSPSLNIAGTGLTLTMWINPQALAGGDSVVLGKFWNATMTDPYYQYGLELTGGTVPNFFVGTTGGPVSASMGIALALNQWSHLAVVFDGSQVLYYLNGTLVTTASLPATITARSNPFRLGADNNTQQFFKGSLDEVRIYNRALTEQEILTDKNTPS